MQTRARSPRKQSPSASTNHLTLISHQSRPASISSVDSLASDDYDRPEEDQLGSLPDSRSAGWNGYDDPSQRARMDEERNSHGEEIGYSLTYGHEKSLNGSSRKLHSPNNDGQAIKANDKGKGKAGIQSLENGGAEAMAEVDQFLEEEGFGDDENHTADRGRIFGSRIIDNEGGDDDDDGRELETSSAGFLSQDERDQMEYDDLLDEEAEPFSTSSSGSGSRWRRRWEGDNKERSLLELIPPLLLSHPMAILPLLSLIPYNFLPAGVVLYVPVFCVLVLLSACAHIVIVYLAWYLKVPSFEDVFAACAAKYGVYGLWGGRIVVLCSSLGLVVGWLGTLHPLIQPLTDRYMSGFLASRIFWTILASATLLPTLVPSRMTRPPRNAPIFLALLIPIVVFLVIGRTVEIKKAVDAAADVIAVAGVAEESGLGKRGLVGAKSSAGAGLTALTIFLTPHLNTLPIQSTLNRNKRLSFPIPCLATSAILLILCLPLALVPYYLLPTLDSVISIDPPSPTPATPLNRTAGVFAHLPPDDGWINFARVLMCCIILGSANVWLLRGRDSMVRAVGGDRSRIGRLSGLFIWAGVVGVACIGGWVAEKIEIVGVIATLAVGWLLPAIFFIITFHVRSPLAIIMQPGTRIYNNLNPNFGGDSNSTSNLGEPTTSPIPSPIPNNNNNSNYNKSNGLGGQITSTLSSSSSSNPSLHSTSIDESRQSRGHHRADSLQDPSMDVLLARKERQLQKRRVERRLWQDLIVYVGILPVGCVTIAWSVGRLIGIW